MITYRNRRAVQLENDQLRLTLLVEGGHIAELLHKPTGVNPLWTPPWPSIEPSAYSLGEHPEYSPKADEGKLLAGIMGHNLCMDLFGDPSEAEAAAGMSGHGEASVVGYEITAEGGGLVQRAVLPQAQLRFQRRLAFAAPNVVRITEEVENIAALDRPIAWTQHVTLGDPFIEPGVTQFRVPAVKSKVIEIDFPDVKGYMKTGAEFTWPHAPLPNGGTVDMRTYSNLPSSRAFSTHLMDPKRPEAFFLAWSPRTKVLIGYVWRSADFPWLGIWEENRRRTSPPWNGRTVTCGMEFGVSPMPESRRQMIDRGRLFGVPAYRWIPARSTVRTEYRAFVMTAEAIPSEPPI